MTDPDQYDRFTYGECDQKHEGKCIDINYGWKTKDGKEVSEIQALRYDKKIWTEDSARAHCKSRGGSFEAAKKTEDRTMKLNYRNSKNAEAMAKLWGKSLDKPEWYKIEALAEDEAEILIYDVIGWPYNDATEFIRNLNGIKAKTITVRINSPGGDVFDGTAIFNALANHPAKIVTRVEGLAASMASALAMAGKEVQAYSNTMMMIHDPWVLAIGNHYELREIADLMEKIGGNLLEIYHAKSKVGKRELAQMMKDETWMTAKEAKEKGFIDTILESGKGVKAQFDLSIFANVPDGLNEDHHEPTAREIEQALRDVGLSQNRAKALIARGLRDGGAMEDVMEACQKILTTLLGGK